MHGGNFQSHHRKTGLHSKIAGTSLLKDGKKIVLNPDAACTSEAQSEFTSSISLRRLGYRFFGRAAGRQNGFLFLITSGVLPGSVVFGRCTTSITDAMANTTGTPEFMGMHLFFASYSENAPEGKSWGRLVKATANLCVMSWHGLGHTIHAKRNLVGNSLHIPDRTAILKWDYARTNTLLSGHG